jgi:DNA-directed RNA polymerase specialized sigma24 family protein
MLLLVVGQLTVQIRTFPWRRRTRAYAANLLLDTKAALWRELRPDRRRGVEHREILVDPLDHQQVTRLLDSAAPDADPEGLRLTDVLVWASRNQVAAAEDLALLAELGHRHLARPADREHLLVEVGREIPTQEDIARRLGITERTLRRRRDRALAALSEVSGRYLRDVA